MQIKLGLTKFLLYYLTKASSCKHNTFFFLYISPKFRSNSNPNNRRKLNQTNQVVLDQIEAIHIKDGESIDDFTMKLTTIVSGIRSLGDKVEGSPLLRNSFELFPRDSCRLLPPSNSAVTSRTCW